MMNSCTSDALKTVSDRYYHNLVVLFAVLTFNDKLRKPDTSGPGLNLTMAKLGNSVVVSFLKNEVSFGIMA